MNNLLEKIEWCWIKDHLSKKFAQFENFLILQLSLVTVCLIIYIDL